LVERAKTQKVEEMAMEADACNPSYSGGRDEEDHGSKPAQGRPYLEKTQYKTGLVEWLK
jgi:hypothetical protein